MRITKDLTHMIQLNSIKIKDESEPDELFEYLLNSSLDFFINNVNVALNISKKRKRKYEQTKI